MTSILLPCWHVGEIFLKLWIQALTLSFMEFLVKDFETHFAKNLHSYLAKKSHPTKFGWTLSRRLIRLMPPPFKPQWILHLLPKSLLPSHNHSGRFIWNPKKKFGSKLENEKTRKWKTEFQDYFNRPIVR